MISGLRRSATFVSVAIAFFFFLSSVRLDRVFGFAGDVLNLAFRLPGRAFNLMFFAARPLTCLAFCTTSDVLSFTFDFVLVHVAYLHPQASDRQSHTVSGKPCTYIKGRTEIRTTSSL